MKTLIIKLIFLIIIQSAITRYIDSDYYDYSGDDDGPYINKREIEETNDGDENDDGGDDDDDSSDSSDDSDSYDYERENDDQKEIKQTTGVPSSTAHGIQTRDNLISKLHQYHTLNAKTEDTTNHPPIAHGSYIHKDHHIDTPTPQIQENQSKQSHVTFKVPHVASGTERTPHAYPDFAMSDLFNHDTVEGNPPHSTNDDLNMQPIKKTKDLSSDQKLQTDSATKVPVDGNIDTVPDVPNQLDLPSKPVSNENGYADNINALLKPPTAAYETSGKVSEELYKNPPLPIKPINHQIRNLEDDKNISKPVDGGRQFQDVVANQNENNDLMHVSTSQQTEQRSSDLNPILVQAKPPVPKGAIISEPNLITQTGKLSNTDQLGLDVEPDAYLQQDLPKQNPIHDETDIHYKSPPLPIKPINHQIRNLENDKISSKPVDGGRQFQDVVANQNENNDLMHVSTSQQTEQRSSDLKPILVQANPPVPKGAIISEPDLITQTGKLSNTGQFGLGVEPDAYLQQDLPKQNPIIDEIDILKSLSIPETQIPESALNPSGARSQLIPPVQVPLKQDIELNARSNMPALDTGIISNPEDNGMASIKDKAVLQIQPITRKDNAKYTRPSTKQSNSTSKQSQTPFHIQLNEKIDIDIDEQLLNILNSERAKPDTHVPSKGELYEERRPRSVDTSRSPERGNRRMRSRGGFHLDNRQEYRMVREDAQRAQITNADRGNLLRIMSAVEIIKNQLDEMDLSKRIGKVLGAENTTVHDKSHQELVLKDSKKTPLDEAGGKTNDNPKQGNDTKIVPQKHVDDNMQQPSNKSERSVGIFPFIKDERKRSIQKFPPATEQIPKQPKPNDQFGKPTGSEPPVNSMHLCISETSNKHPLAFPLESQRLEDTENDLQTIHKSLHSLATKMEKGLTTMLDQVTDFSNMEDTDIKANRDKIFLLHNTMTNKFDELQANISGLMDSQKKQTSVINDSLINLHSSLKRIEHFQSSQSGAGLHPEGINASAAAIHDSAGTGQANKSVSKPNVENIDQPHNLNLSHDSTAQIGGGKPDNDNLVTNHLQTQVNGGGNSRTATVHSADSSAKISSNDISIDYLRNNLNHIQEEITVLKDTIDHETDLRHTPTTSPKTEETQEKSPKTKETQVIDHKPVDLSQTKAAGSHHSTGTKGKEKSHHKPKHDHNPPKTSAKSQHAHGHTNKINDDAILKEIDNENKASKKHHKHTKLPVKTKRRLLQQLLSLKNRASRNFLANLGIGDVDSSNIVTKRQQSWNRTRRSKKKIAHKPHTKPQTHNDHSFLQKFKSHPEKTQ